jgi:hypothetical protein
VYLQRCEQSERVEHGWAKHVGDAADVGDGALGLAQQLSQQLGGPAGVGGDEVSGGLDFHGEGRQLRAETVVQITSDAAPFLLPGNDQLLTGALQVRGEPDGVHGGADLAGEVVEDLSVRGGEFLTPTAAAEDKPPDILARMCQLQAQQPCPVAGPLTAFGGGDEWVSPADLNRGVGQLQCL